MNKIVLGLITAIVIYVLIMKNQEPQNVSKQPPKTEITEDSDNQLLDNEELDNDELDTEINTEDANSFFEMTENAQDLNSNVVEENVEKTLVYLDINTNGHTGRIIIELNFGVVPKTCNNFLILCEKKAYKNTKFHRVIKDFMVQGGDFTNNDGTGGVSIYGDTFEDENFKLKNKKGTISMANSGQNTNGSQFFINVIDTPWLDNKHVVFGHVVKGIDLIEWISDQETNQNDTPLNDVIIEDCGRL